MSEESTETGAVNANDNQLTEDVMASIMSEHREKDREIDKVQQMLNSLRKGRTNFRKTVSGKYGFKLGDFDIAYLAATTDDGEDKYRAGLIEQNRLLRMMGNPVGTQLDLEDYMQDTTAAEDRAYCNGKRAYYNNETDADNPHDVSTPAGQAWLKGYNDQQALVASGMRKRAEIEVDEKTADTGDDERTDEEVAAEVSELEQVGDFSEAA